jgi:hypothetical protein
VKKLTKYTKIAAVTMLSGLAALSFGGFANASTVIPTGTTVKICRSILGAYPYNAITQTFNYTFTAGTGLDSTTMPSGQISFTSESSSTGEISKCIDVDVGGVTFTDTSPKQASVRVNESADSPTGAEATSKNFNIVFDLRNTVDSSSQITGQTASLAYIEDGLGTKKLSQIDITTSVVPFQYMTLTNQVGGTGGDPNKEFTYTVTLNGPIGSSYFITKAGSQVKSCDYSQACTIGLKNGETAYIGRVSSGPSLLQPGTTYSIVQTSVSGYTTQHQIESSSWVSGLDTSQQTIAITADGHTDVVFKNVKDADVPTGIFLNVWPYILLGAASVTIIVCAKKNFATKKH